MKRDHTPSGALWRIAQEYATSACHRMHGWLWAETALLQPNTEAKMRALRRRLALAFYDAMNWPPRPKGSRP